MTLAVPDDVVGPKKKIVDELWWEFFSYPSQWWYHRAEKVNGNNCSLCYCSGLSVFGRPGLHPKLGGMPNLSDQLVLGFCL
jgi:hypothetical protein